MVRMGRAANLLSEHRAGNFQIDGSLVHSACALPFADSQQLSVA